MQACTTQVYTVTVYLAVHHNLHLCVLQVVTGLMTRPDMPLDFPLGIVPVGTANAMANYLDKESSTSNTMCVMCVCVCVCVCACVKEIECIPCK